MTGTGAGPALITVAVLVAAAATVLRGPPPAARLRRLDGRVPAGPVALVVRQGRQQARRVVDRRRGGPAARELAERWAAELRAGHGVDQALSLALRGHRATARYRRTELAARTHGDVATALRADADDMRQPDRQAVRALAACWTVGRNGGGGLADAVERVAESVRADEVHRGHVRSELAGARSSARLLAALPILVLAMSAGLGLASPAVMLTNGWAAVSVVVGLALAACGVWWTERIARAAERAV